jgi:hypothetical protein
LFPSVVLFREDHAGFFDCRFQAAPLSPHVAFI